MATRLKEDFLARVVKTRRSASRKELSALGANVRKASAATAAAGEITLLLEGASVGPGGDRADGSGLVSAKSTPQGAKRTSQTSGYRRMALPPRVAR